MKHARPQCSIRARLLKDLHKMPRHTRTTTRNHRDLNRPLHHLHQFKIETRIAAVAINTIQQELATAHSFDRGGELHGIDVAAFTTAAHGALVPAEALAGGAGGICFDGGVRRTFSIVDVDAARVDADDDGLLAVGG